MSAGTGALTPSVTAEGEAPWITFYAALGDYTLWWNPTNTQEPLPKLIVVTGDQPNVLASIVYRQSAPATDLMIEEKADSMFRDWHKLGLTESDSDGVLSRGLEAWRMMRMAEALDENTWHREDGTPALH